VLVALTSGQKTGLAVVAAAVVVLALASRFLFPRYSPDFPGRWLRPFLLVCVLVAVGMLTAVVVLPTTQPPPQAGGDPEAGKALYISQCGSCHTLTKAGVSGNVGPSLDVLPAAAKRANRGTLEEFVRESIVDPNAYVEPGFQPDVMPLFAQGLLTDQEVEHVVAFLIEDA